MAYDVFISFKNTAPGGGLTLDRTIAERLHMKLRDEGLNVFFSEKDLSTAAFMDEIYQALDEANLLILVGTSVEYINSRWVKSEWSTFFGSIQSGRKENGHIITVLKDISTRDLPIQLEHFESFNASDIDGAVDFAFKTLGKVKKSEAAAWLAEEQERKRREAEEAAVLEAQKRLEAERQAARERAASEEKVAEAQAESKQQAGQNKVLKIVAAVLAAVLIFGVSYGVGMFVTQQKENESIAEAEPAVNPSEPLTEADRALDEIYDFEWEGSGFMITGYSGEGGDVVLPNEYNGKPVTSIGSFAFEGCYSLTSIIIPDSVTSIGYGAFLYCESLTSITIPDSVTSIDEMAFYNCGPTSITIPDSVISIGKSAFESCANLTSITIPDSVTSVGDCAFRLCENLSSVTIPNSVTSIGNNAFRLCSSLKSITIPDSITTIGDGMFYGCSSLKSVTIPDSVTKIDNNAFCDCDALTSITIPNSVTDIGRWAFSDCDGLAAITIPDSVTSIGNSAFYGYPITVTAPHEASYYGYTPDDGVTWRVQ
ncbi:MAG: TIR domain-containing protein [Ruminococcaceae bacterium]|nr:TIR domain-containing protein [Oscillospiraceae bacterium]